MADDATGGEALSFQVSRPGLAFEVKADLAARRATVQQQAYNVWGLVNTLHTFGGVRANDRVNVRDWPLTTIWVLSMDALAGGPGADGVEQLRDVVSAGGKATRGGVALVLGVASCGLFVVGVRWLT